MLAYVAAAPALSCSQHALPLPGTEACGAQADEAEEDRRRQRDHAARRRRGWRGFLDRKQLPADLAVGELVRVDVDVEPPGEQVGNVLVGQRLGRVRVAPLALDRRFERVEVV